MRGWVAGTWKERLGRGRSKEQIRRETAAAAKAGSGRALVFFPRATEDLIRTAK